jgi:GAF domain-containing protein
VGKITIGALDIQSAEEAAFNYDDVTIFQTMADQIAVAFENARLLDEMQLAVQELETASGAYTQDTWREAARGRSRPRGYRYQRLGVQAVEEQPAAASEAWLQRRPVIASGAAVSEDGSQGLLTTLAVPIVLRGQVVGVLHLGFEGEIVSSDMISLVEEVSGRLALALENARLLEETQQLADRERRIGAITAQVRSSMDVDSILRTAVREVGKALGSDRAFIRLGQLPDRPEQVETELEPIEIDLTEAMQGFDMGAEGVPAEPVVEEEVAAAPVVEEESLADMTEKAPVPDAGWGEDVLAEASEVEGVSDSDLDGLAEGTGDPGGEEFAWDITTT